MWCLANNVSINYVFQNNKSAISVNSILLAYFNLCLKKKKWPAASTFNSKCICGTDLHKTDSTLLLVSFYTY